MKRIMFVDDEPRVLQGLRNTLRSQRHRWDMLFVVGGEEALRHLEQSPVDVLVTDIRMPGMDGVALLRHVHARYPGVRCLALSGYAEFAAQEEACSMVHRFLVKPCDPADLRRSIEDALGDALDGDRRPSGGIPEARPA